MKLRIAKKIDSKPLYYKWSTIERASKRRRQAQRAQCHFFAEVIGAGPLLTKLIVERPLLTKPIVGFDLCG